MHTPLGPSAQPMVSRRLFVGGVAAAALLPALARRARAEAAAKDAYGARLGFQAYSVRNQLAKDPAGVLGKVAAFGYREVELFSPAQVTDYAPITHKLGLQMVSLHMPGFFSKPGDWAKWQADGRPADPAGYGLDALLKSLRAHGLRYVGYPHGAPDEATKSPAAYLQFVAHMEAVGDLCRKAGLTFFYHNHHHEFAKAGDGTFLDVLVKHTDPAHVALEVDVCWVAQAGLDPVALINAHAARVKLLHLKDRKAGIPTSTGPGWPQGNIFAPVGKGTLDMPAILRAAHAAKVEHVFVEQDESDGDSIEDLGTSFRYVQGTGL